MRDDCYMGRTHHSLQDNLKSTVHSMFTVPNVFGAWQHVGEGWWWWCVVEGVMAVMAVTAGITTVGGGGGVWARGDSGRGGKVRFWTLVQTWTCWTEPIGSGSVRVQFSPYPIGSGSGSGTDPECRTSSEPVWTSNLGSSVWREMARYTCNISTVWQCASCSIQVLQTSVFTALYQIIVTIVQSLVCAGHEAYIWYGYSM